VTPASPTRRRRSREGGSMAGVPSRTSELGRGGQGAAAGLGLLFEISN
jgi:hypothetical protein